MPIKTNQKPRHMPVMKEKCKTCPFGPNGDPQLRSEIEARILTEASQTCHTTGVALGKREDTHLCRGARDFQLMILHRMGFLEAATDEAWEKKCQELKI